MKKIFFEKKSKFKCDRILKAKFWYIILLDGKVYKYENS